MKQRFQMRQHQVFIGSWREIGLLDEECQTVLDENNAAQAMQKDIRQNVERYKQKRRQ